MNLTTNTIIKLFIDAIGQDAFKDFYDSNWEARKKESQKLLKNDYNFDIIHDSNFQRIKPCNLQGFVISKNSFSLSELS